MRVRVRVWVNPNPLRFVNGFGKSWNGVIILIYLQSSCHSPFLGKYVGTVTAEHYWMSIILRGKELMINQHGHEAKYPRKIPSLFQSAPIEDYDKAICDYLCKNEKKRLLGNHIIVTNSILVR